MLADARKAGEIGKEIEALQDFLRNFKDSKRIDIRWTTHAGNDKNQFVIEKPGYGIYRPALYNPLYKSLTETVEARIEVLYEELKQLLRQGTLPYQIVEVSHE